MNKFTKLSLTKQQLEKRKNLSLLPWETLSWKEKLLKYNLGKAEKLYDKNYISVWTDYLAPVEIFNAMGIVPMVLESESALLARIKKGSKYIRIAEGYLGNVNLCNFQKCALGAFIDGFLPPPKLLVSTSHPCDGAGKICEVLEHMFGIPYFLIDMPYADDERAVDYLVRQFKDLFIFFQKHTGLEMDENKLVSTLDMANQACSWLEKAQNLRETKFPLIFGTRSMGLSTAFQSMGTPQGVDIYRSFYHELQAKKITLEKSRQEELEEYKKVLWFHFRPFYDTSLLEYMESELKTVIMELINLFRWPYFDLNHPLEGIARKLLAFPLGGEIENRIRTHSRLIKKYRADGVIGFLHLGCRQVTGGFRFCLDNFRQMGIPFLDISGDCIDESNYSESQMRTRIEAFVEMLHK